MLHSLNIENMSVNGIMLFYSEHLSDNVELISLWLVSSWLRRHGVLFSAVWLVWVRCHVTEATWWWWWWCTIIDQVWAWLAAQRVLAVRHWLTTSRSWEFSRAAATLSLSASCLFTGNINRTVKWNSTIIATHPLHYLVNESRLLVAVSQMAKMLQHSEVSSHLVFRKTVACGGASD